MIRLLRTFGAVVLVLGACGGSEASKAPVTGSASTQPATTATNTTTAAPSTTPPPTSTTVDPAAQAVADRIPAVPSYSYGEMLPMSWWSIEGQLAGASRPILADGSWVGEVSVADAGTETPGGWASFVNDHHSELDVLGGPPVETGDQLAFSMNTAVPRWELFGNEVVLAAATPAEGTSYWTGVWYHDGLVWGVTGLESQARAFARSIIDQQAGTGAEPEPEQVDIDVLEGPLAGLTVDVPGFEYFDAHHSEVLGMFSTWGDCADHVSMHTVHPANDPDATTTFDDADIALYMTLYSDLTGCEGGRDVIGNVLAGGGAVSTEIQGLPAATTTDGSIIIWHGADGIVVEADAANAAALDRYRPLLEAIAQVSAA